MKGISSVKTENEIGYQNSLQKKIIDNISDNMEISNTLSQDAAVTLSISALSTDELEEVRKSWDNHPVSHLYKTEVPVNKNSDGIYKIGKVDFSEDEFLAARSLITDIGNQLKKGYLSYRDYAKMEMAEKVVDKCAHEGFSEEQAQVICRAMKDYNSNLIKNQNEILAKRDIIHNDDPKSGKYFGVQVSISKEARELYNMSANLKYADTDIATNQELIDEIREGIRREDVTGKDMVDRIKQFYQSLMKPVYSSQYPFQRESDVNDAITHDIDDLMRMIDYSKEWKSRT